ncbi:MAG TPA: LON peptidase substrate-binding domain-containing protein [Candidatus Polarisedimenticolaceae bacterium]|nr:LON peptidase substrate-binding domain-containing protein [Candidatus Polarisedimenticolaceae bacterium]
MLPEVIPVFPLPNVVFFPRMPLPLHIFEPRYRDMVRDAARGARLIGMVLLRGDWERDYEGRPPIYGTGTVGEMVRVEELPDGRFDIVLRGVREYTIMRELERAAYREAVVTWREGSVEPLSAGTRQAIRGLVRRYLALLGRKVADDEILRESVDDETFVNFLAQHLDVAPVEKQAMLEAGSLAERARRLSDVLEFRLQELPSGSSGRAH